MRDDEQDALDDITAMLNAAADAVGAPRPQGPFRAERRGRFIVVEGGKKIAEPGRITVQGPGNDDNPPAA